MFTKSYLLGLGFITSCAVIWSCSSILLQHIYEDLNFKSPFFLTYFANTLMILYLPIWQLWYLFGPLKTNDSGLNKTRGSLSSSDDSGDNACAVHKKAFGISLIVAPTWFAANCLYNYSLLMTSNSSSTIISNTSASFTLAFSWWWGLEEISYFKIYGLLACFAGAACIGVQDQSNAQQRTLVGDIIALLSSVGYGIYTTTIRYNIPNDEDVSMQLLLGYIGLLNLVFLSPVVLVLYLLGMDNLKHLTGSIVGFISLNGFFDNVISDYLWARSVILTSPTVATIGMSITIPLAMTSDFILNGFVPNSLSIMGAILVLIGFLFVNVPKVYEVKFVFVMKTYLYMLCGFADGHFCDSNRASLEVYNIVSTVDEKNEI
eukprot:gene8033-10886_t